MKRETKVTAGNLGRYMLAFCKWVLAAVALGAVCGGVGAVFHNAIDAVTELRMEQGWILWLLPGAGALTWLLYKLCRVGFSVGTNEIFKAAGGEGHVPFLLAPLIFMGTLLSHLSLIHI